MNLNSKEVELFYKLRLSLIAYANQRFTIIRGATTPEEIKALPVQEIAKIGDRIYASPDVMDRYVKANPDEFSPEEVAIVAGWRYFVRDAFFILRHLKKYTIFLSSKKPTHLYGVLGIHDSLEEVTGLARLPVMVDATLLPFLGRVIYDGIMAFHSISFGGGIRSSLNESYRRLNDREGIIESILTPDGEPQSLSSLARKTPSKPTKDWGPALDQIVDQTEKMRQTDSRMASAAFGLLRAAASLAQASLQKNTDIDFTSKIRAARTSLTKMERALRDDANGY